MLTTRRSLFVTAAGGALVLAGCSAGQIQQAQQAWANVVDAIQKTVAKAAQYVPTIESVAAEAAALFGPQYTAIVTAGSAAFNQVINILVGVVNSLSPPAQSAMRARLRSSTINLPIRIGTSPQGVVIVGFQAR